MRRRGAAIKPRGVRPVQTSAGGSRGPGGAPWSWNPLRLDRDGEARERETAGLRVEDLLYNDPHAASVIDAQATNVVGVGLRPQSQLRWRQLGISEEQAADVQEQMEWAWKLWCQEAHAGGRAHFQDLQYLAIRSMLGKGEYLFACRMLKKPGRTFNFALQDIHPSRLSTPSDMARAENLHDGVEVDADGAPVAYWLANPAHDAWGCQPSSAYTRVPAAMGHRPLILHAFRYVNEETYRGRSVLAPGIKLFKFLGESLDYELVAQLVSASFPVVIKSHDPNGYVSESYDPEDKRYHTRIAPGQVAYLNLEEEAQVLSSNRPGQNWQSFVTLILRAMAASSGVPYEVLSKDFSQTNYSSARAALAEAWRLFLMYRTWLGRTLCAPAWAMVQEEAILRGLVKLPRGAPSFYQAKPLWLSARWIGPARGYVDPVKETLANIQALDRGIATYEDVVAEQGGYWEETFEQRHREQAKAKELGLELAGGGQAQARPEPAREQEDA